MHSYSLCSSIKNFEYKCTFRCFFSVLDSSGKLPSGIMSGNFFDFGAFSQCFHIKRNGINYKTQYCIGQFKLPSERRLLKSSNLPR